MGDRTKRPIFPEDFQWGVATSAFQLEGSPNADWTTWDPVLRDIPADNEPLCPFPGGPQTPEGTGRQCLSLLLEWSRIQPREDTWDEEAIAHYQEIIDILRSYNIEPMVTLHHFTHPRWFLERSPWHWSASIEKFLRYTEMMVSTLRNVRYWITFNEPYVILIGGYLDGCTPPGLRDVPRVPRGAQKYIHLPRQGLRHHPSTMSPMPGSASRTTCPCSPPGKNGTPSTGS